MQFRNPPTVTLRVFLVPSFGRFCSAASIFAVKGVWKHALLGFIAALMTSGLSWLVYPFFATAIMKKHYLRNGWSFVDESMPVVETPFQSVDRTEFAKRHHRIVREPAAPAISRGDILFYFALGVCALTVLGSVMQIVTPDGERVPLESQQSRTGPFTPTPFGSINGLLVTDMAPIL